MNTTKLRRRGTLRVRIAIILSIGLWSALGLTTQVADAAAENRDRKTKFRLVAEDVDNEGPIGREGWGLPGRSHPWDRPGTLTWHSPVRIDLILPLKSFPRTPFRRR